MASFRCGGTGLVRDNPDPKLVRICPGCLDCSRCYGSRQLFHFAMVTVDGKQGTFGGDTLYTLRIENCPGCADCKVNEGKSEPAVPTERAKAIRAALDVEQEKPPEPEDRRCGTCANQLPKREFPSPEVRDKFPERQFDIEMHGPFCACCVGGGSTFHNNGPAWHNCRFWRMRT